MHRLNSTSINVLKILATTLVFLCHSEIIAKECFNINFHGLWHLLNTPAWGGVWIFLIISGFLACYGFDSGKYQISRKSILNYYKGRYIKILLPTYIFLSLAFIFNMQESNVQMDSIIRWLTCTFNGHGGGIKQVGASWYVFIVFWLYILSPIFVYLLNKYENGGGQRM